MKVKIEIDTKTFVRFWLVVIGFAFAILAIYSARTALIVIGVAFFLALALNSPVTRLAKYMPHKSRIVGTAIAYILVVVILGAFIFLVVPPIAQQTVKFAENVPNLIDDVTAQSGALNAVVDQYGLQPQVDSAIASIKDNATSWAAQAGKNIVSGLGSLLSLIVSTFLVLVLSFLMLIEGPAWLRRLWTVYSDRERMEHHRELLGRMYNVVTGYVTGQLTVSAIGALSAGMTVFVLSLLFNVPANLALPTMAIAFTLSLIPMFGSTIAGILIALLLLLNDASAGIIFVIYFIIYQQIENNFISPAIQSKKVELSALVVLASVTIGLYVFGLAGGIISIPIAGSIKVLLEDYIERSKKKHGKAEKPFAKFTKKIQGHET
ncbi:MAG TPA: AI-2E family transporter [Candidatus Saccharimonadales bacterium]|nr:AI-2E family transporter [Candidatus Saccharimonadales bacterium]